MRSSRSVCWNTSDFVISPASRPCWRRTVRRNGGRGLLHFIGRDVQRPLNPWIRRRIFPAPTPYPRGGDDEGAGTSGDDGDRRREPASALRAHAGALGERFAAAEEQVVATFGDEFARAWRLYLSGSEAAFATGWMQLFQVVFTPRESNPPSWTRSDLTSFPGCGAVSAATRWSSAAVPLDRPARARSAPPAGTWSWPTVPDSLATKYAPVWLMLCVFELLELDPAE